MLSHVFIGGYKVAPWKYLLVPVSMTREEVPRTSGCILEQPMRCSEGAMAQESQAEVHLLCPHKCWYLLNFVPAKELEHVSAHITTCRKEDPSIPVAPCDPKLLLDWKLKDPRIQSLHSRILSSSSLGNDPRTSMARPRMPNSSLNGTLEH